MTQISQTEKKFRTNKQIRAKEVRLIGVDGAQIGIVSIKEALDTAEHAELDLVEINPTSKPPICKLMDYGKFRYEQNKKERESRLKRKTIEVKEVKIRPKIDTHDYETKKKTAIRLLKDGNKVKLILTFRGRELVYRKHGIDLMKKMAEELSDISVLEREPKLEGKNLVMILTPKT